MSGNPYWTVSYPSSLSCCHFTVIYQLDVFLLCTSGGSFCAYALDGNIKGSPGATSNARVCTGRRPGSEQEEEGGLTRHASPRWFGLEKGRVLRVNSPEQSHWLTYGNERIQILPKAHSSSLAT